MHAGIAGGADMILLPEIPYDIDVVAQVIEKRSKSGKAFTIHCGCGGSYFQGRCEAEKERI